MRGLDTGWCTWTHAAGGRIWTSAPADPSPADVAWLEGQLATFGLELTAVDPGPVIVVALPKVWGRTQRAQTAA